MCNSSSSVLVLNRTSPSLLHTFVAYTTQLLLPFNITVILFYTNTSRVNAFGRLLVSLSLSRSYATVLSLLIKKKENKVVIVIFIQNC